MDSIRKQVTDNLDQPLDILPPRIQSSIELCGGLEQLVEIVMDLGRLPEARYFDSTKYLTDDPITKEDLALCVKQVGEFGGDNRAGIERTPPYQCHPQPQRRNHRANLSGWSSCLWHDRDDSRLSRNW